MVGMAIKHTLFPKQQSQQQKSKSKIEAQKIHVINSIGNAHTEDLGGKNDGNKSRLFSFSLHFYASNPNHILFLCQCYLRIICFWFFELSLSLHLMFTFVSTHTSEAHLMSSHRSKRKKMKKKQTIWLIVLYSKYQLGVVLLMLNGLTFEPLFGNENDFHEKCIHHLHLWLTNDA